MTFAYFCIWQIGSDFWECWVCWVFASQPLTSLWQRAPYHSLANKTIGSNVQTEKYWISECLPYALHLLVLLVLSIHFKASFQLNNYIHAFCHACKEDEMQQVQVYMREVQTRKKWKFFHHEDSRGTGWPHSWSFFEQKVGLETSWGPFQTELSSVLSGFKSAHRDSPSSTSSLWWVTLWRPAGFWPSPVSPGPPWEMIDRKYGTRNSQLRTAGNLQLQSTLVHPQGALAKLLIFITHLGRCVCLIYVD